MDLQGSKAEECAARIIGEMASSHENATVAFRRAERFVETLEPFNLSSAPERPRLEHGGVYLITGGVGGLGLVVAEHLARDFKARLVLVGRSKLPPESQWEVSLNDAQLSESSRRTIRKLIEIRSFAGGLLVAQADVTNLTQMREVVSLARKQFGKIDGVFHAAGVLDDGPLMLKSAHSAASVLDPKVRGTLVLEEALRDQPLSCFVLFSSISSIFPPAGQVDYAAANAFLDAFALSRKGPVTAINWGIWQEVGMGARASSSHPWLEQRLLETPDAIVYASQFSQQRQWVLSEHRFKTGIALIPGTGHMEMVAGAFTRGSLRGPAKFSAFEFQDVFFLAPLMFSSSESKEVRVQLKREREAGADKGAFHFSVFSQAGEWVEHSSGRIAPCLSRPGTNVDRAAIASRCRERMIVFDDEHRTRQERQFDFGPRWRSLRRLHVGNREGLAEIELDEKFSADVSDLRVHPALLDMATGASLYLTSDYESSDDLFLPISYKRMCVHRPIPARLYSHIRARQENAVQSEVETFDIMLFNEQEQVIAEIEGFVMRRIGDPAKVLEGKLAPRETVHSVAERPIEIADVPGIRPNAGAQALTRILLADTPPGVIVVAEPPPELDFRPATPSKRTISAAPPNEGVEGTLASWWKDMLGVEVVGMDDDFFALGGHSLVGVRLFAKIKKTYQVDLELAALFEARTVRQLAELIRKSQQPAAAEQKTFSALVPIQPRGSRIPLFCVHAIGGDVLFYEQLAKALGPDQPFYAFQSPLVYRTDARNFSFEELASIYVKEMCEFFPQGPYLLGGASYGGLVIFEMARQLHAQGIEPGLVIMFDTGVPGNETVLKTGKAISKFLHNIRSQGLPYLARKAAEKSKYWVDELGLRLLTAECALYRIMGWPLPASLRFHQLSKDHWRAMAGYTFKPYPGRITLMRAIDRGTCRLHDGVLHQRTLWQKSFKIETQHFPTPSVARVGVAPLGRCHRRSQAA